MLDRLNYTFVHITDMKMRKCKIYSLFKKSFIERAITIHLDKKSAGEVKNEIKIMKWRAMF